MLLGEYRLTLDRAGRFRLPAIIRHALHELDAPDDTMLIGTTFYEHCLVFFPRAEWLKTPEQ
jgi:DNA-binding transcriptional regulator/RsmH inhibitor MraZ